MTFKNLYFGYSNDGLAATEWYPEAIGFPAWWPLPVVPTKVRAQEIGAGTRGFAVPWAMFIDYDDRFWLNGNYSVYPEPSERACMEVARTSEGYFVGLFGCPERTWSPEGGIRTRSCPSPYSTSAPPKRFARLQTKGGCCRGPTRTSGNNRARSPNRNRAT